MDKGGTTPKTDVLVPSFPYCAFALCRFLANVHGLDMASSLILDLGSNKLYATGRLVCLCSIVLDEGGKQRVRPPHNRCLHHKATWSVMIASEVERSDRGCLPSSNTKVDQPLVWERLGPRCALLTSSCGRRKSCVFFKPVHCARKEGLKHQVNPTGQACTATLVLLRLALSEYQCLEVVKSVTKNSERVGDMSVLPLEPVLGQPNLLRPI